MVTVEEARQQLETAKTQVATQKEKVGEAEKNISEQRNKLPVTTSQKALRSSMSGLQGRNIRRQVAQTGRQLTEKEGEISSFKEEITGYEQQLGEQEAVIKEAEAEKALYDKVVMQIQREAQGKKGSILDTKVERDLYSKLLKENPSLREAIDMGTEAKMKAQDAGYSSVAQFQEMQLIAGKQLGLDVLKTPSGQEIGLTDIGIEKLSTRLNELQSKGDVIDFKKFPQFDLKTTVRIEDRTTRVQNGFMSPALVKLDSSDKSLNMSRPSQINDTGTISLLSGMAVGVQSGDSGGTQSRNIFQRIGSAFGMGDKKGYEAQKEVFVSGIGEVGAFVPNIQRTDTGTIEGIRLPTLDEKVILQRGENNLLTANIEGLKKRYNQASLAQVELRNINNEFKKLQVNIDKEGRWTGTQEDLDKYNDLVNKQTRYSAQANQKINVGFGGGRTERDLLEYGFILKGDRSSGLFAPITAGLETVGRQAEVGYSAVADYLSTKAGANVVILRDEKGNIIDSTAKVKDIPEQNIIMTFPFQEKGTSFISDKGFYTPLSLIKIEAKTVREKNVYDVLGTGARVTSKVAYGGTMLLPYLNPYGDLIFGLQQTERLGFNVAEKGSVKSGAVSWFKESPVESAVAIGIPLFKLTKFIKSKAKIGKENKYLSEPEVTIINKETKVIKNKLPEEINVIKKEVSVAKDGSVIQVDALQKTRKGVVSEIEYYPSEDIIGTIKEYRDVGNIKFSFERGKSFLDSKIRIERPLKLFEGTIEQTGGITTQVIKYTDDITKITTIDELSKGKVKLFKDGNLILSRDIEPVISNLDLKKKVTEQNIKYEDQIRNPIDILDTRIETKNIRLLNRNILTQEGGLNLVGDINTNLKATKINVQSKSFITKARDISKGYSSIQVDSSFFSDIITSGARQGEIIIRTPRGNIRLSKKVGLEIIYGNEKELDKVFRETIGSTNIFGKSISPSTSRELVSGSGTKTIEIFVNPESKLFNPTKKLLELRKVESEKLFKTIRQEETLRKAKNLLEAFKEAEKKLGSRASTFISAPEKQVAENIILDRFPRMVGGQGLQLNPLSLTDEQLAKAQKFLSQMETTTYLKAPQIKSPVISNVEPSVIIKTIPRVETGFERGFLSIRANLDKELINEKVKLNLLDKEVQQNKIVNINKIKSLEMIKEVSKEKQISQVKQVSLLKSLLKTEQVQKSEQKQTQRQKSESKKQTDRTKTKPSIVIKPKTTTILSESKPSAKETLGNMFEVYKRKKGGTEDYELVGEEVNLFKAGKKASEILKSGLEATAFIKEKRTGRKISFGEVASIVGGEFRQSKKSPFLIIQRKEKRLGTQPEVLKIKRARGKSKWL